MWDRPMHQDAATGRWYQGQPDAERELIREAVHETDDEIMHSAFDEEPDEGTGPDELLESVEGWDGEPLSDFEVAHTNIYGHDDVANYDRQVALHADRELLEQNQQLQQQNQQIRQQYDAEFNAPERIAGRRAEQLGRIHDITGLMPTDDAKATSFLGAVDHLAAQNQQLQENHINSSMTLAHERYGDNFVEAFQSLQNTRDAATIGRITNSADPGSSLMAWHSGRGEYAGGRGFMPSLNSHHETYSARAPSRGSRGRAMATMDDGFGDEAVEQDIFNSVWDN